MESPQNLSLKALRVATIESYGLNKPYPAGDLDLLVELAAGLCETSIAFLAVLDDRGEYWLARYGIEVQGYSLEQAISAETVLGARPLIVPDLVADTRFESHPLVSEAPSLRFYAGVPLTSPEGVCFGSLGVMAAQRRSLSDKQLKSLEQLAGQVMSLLALRREIIRLQTESQQYRTAVETAEVGVWEIKMAREPEVWFSSQVYQRLGLENGDPALTLAALSARVHPDDVSQYLALIRQFPKPTGVTRALLRLSIESQGYHWFVVRGQAVWDELAQTHKWCGILLDIHQHQRSHLAFEHFHEHQERLYRISYNLTLSQAEFLQAGLEVLCDYYALKSAIVSRVQGGVYQILAVRNGPTYAQGHLVEPGQKLPLAGSFVMQIFDQSQVITLEELLRQDAAKVSLAAEYDIQALIGSPYWLNEHAHGVVTCFGSEAREQGFSALDIEFMRAFCRWLSFMTEKRYFIEHLQTLSLSKDRMLAVVAHDLRNPLAAMVMAKRCLDMNLAAKRPPDPRMLAVIENSYQRAAQLLDELLEAAELEQADQHVPLEALNLVAFVKGILTRFEPLAAEKELQLLFQPEKDQVLVGLNPQKMERVFENLLNNALKFTPAGGCIEVNVNQQGQTACVTVEDTGIGIPEHLQEVLFDKYTAARRSGLQGEQSNGLGMFIVREIVQLHGGKIHVSSREHRGTCFKIELPLVQNNVH